MRQREDALRQREETFTPPAERELETQVRQARQEIDDVIADAESEAAAIAEAAAPGVTTGDTGAARSDARAAVDAVVSGSVSRKATQPSCAAAAESRMPRAVGDRVIVGGLGLEAIVTSVHDGTADLDVRGKRHARERPRSARHRRRADGAGARGQRQRRAAAARATTARS